jgi:hypothetical protein
MSDDNSKSRILAHWHFTNAQWREFLYYEKLDFESRNLVDLRTILTAGVGIFFLVALIGAAKGGSAVFIFGLFAGSLFIGFCYLIRRLVRQSAEQRVFER